MREIVKGNLTFYPEIALSRILKSKNPACFQAGFSIQFFKYVFFITFDLN